MQSSSYSFTHLHSAGETPGLHLLTMFYSPGAAEIHYILIKMCPAVHTYQTKSAIMNIIQNNKDNKENPTANNGLNTNNSVRLTGPETQNNQII